MAPDSFILHSTPGSMARQSPNQALEPTAGRCDVQFNSIKQSSMLRKLAAASGVSAPSR
jgi:hypothetical protein